MTKQHNGTASVDTAKSTARVDRTSAGLRDALFDELDALRRGESSPARAHAVGKIARSIIETARAEIEMHRYIDEAKKEKAGIAQAREMLPPVALGSQH